MLSALKSTVVYYSTKGCIVHMINNRLYNRYSVTCNGEITDNSHHNYSFVMNDMSAGGMSITTDKEILDENALTIHFDISQFHLPRTTQLRGTVVRKIADHSIYNYGIRFFDVTSMEIIEIDEYLRFRHYSALVHMVENPTENI